MLSESDTTLCVKDFEPQQENVQRREVEELKIVPEQIVIVTLHKSLVLLSTDTTLTTVFGHGVIDCIIHIWRCGLPRIAKSLVHIV